MVRWHGGDIDEGEKFLRQSLDSLAAQPEVLANLGDREHIGKILQPKEGHLVLFPSYMFHGTVPFPSNEIRTTIAFDVMPV